MNQYTAFMFICFSRFILEPSAIYWYFHVNSCTSHYGVTSTNKGSLDKRMYRGCHKVCFACKNQWANFVNLFPIRHCHIDDSSLIIKKTNTASNVSRWQTLTHLSHFQIGQNFHSFCLACYFLKILDEIWEDVTKHQTKWQIVINSSICLLYTQRQWKVTSIKVSIFRKIYNAALWLLLRSCFWSTTSWFGEIKQLHDPWNYGARDARAFYVFCSF